MTFGRSAASAESEAERVTTSTLRVLHQSDGFMGLVSESRIGEERWEESFGRARKLSLFDRIVIDSVISRC